MSDSFIFIIFIFLALLVMLLLLLVIQFTKRGNSSGNSLDSFCIEGDKLTVKTGLFQPIYLIEEIEYIKFCCFKVRHGYMGNYRVFKTNGQKSRIFIFDGSVYTGRLQLVSTKEDIMKSIEKMREELWQNGIRSES